MRRHHEHVGLRVPVEKSTAVPGREIHVRIRATGELGIQELQLMVDGVTDEDAALAATVDVDEHEPWRMTVAGFEPETFLQLEIIADEGGLLGAFDRHHAVLEREDMHVAL